ncbi:zinc-dependent alcohol dehydrogenase [Sphaerisporangium perillae]|uniref:zinc-dependent alcohol dehydrogenase n=1 Tax=Sphaerisporangium perillae TaxID=2935860 RepID=UPI00200FE417|nr:alcohol dehydrogenase catalytic domain-containing protein [Sphaerisporangium perillae]
MRAFILTAPRTATVSEVDPPVAGPGQVVVDVACVGVCGTDMEFYSGEMAYLKQGHAAYPLRLGHEWCGTISAVGDGVDDALLGTRTTGDTMLGCGACRRCLSGRHHVCESRHEIGIRNGWPGALAERLLVPVTALRPLPGTVDDTAGALVEPGGNALRSVRGADLSPGDRALVLGPGTIGLLAGLFARAAGAEVHFLGKERHSLEFARTLGFDGVWIEDTLPGLPFDAVIDASNAPALPAAALDLVEPGKRVVYIGLAGRPSLIDTRTLALKDVTAVGILGASAALDGTIEQYASGAVDPRPLVAATVGFEELAEVLAGGRPPGAGPGPKIHVDPRR